MLIDLDNKKSVKRFTSEVFRLQRQHKKTCEMFQSHLRAASAGKTFISSHDIVRQSFVKQRLTACLLSDVAVIPFFTSCEDYFVKMCIFTSLELPMHCIDIMPISDKISAKQRKTVQRGQRGCVSGSKHFTLVMVRQSLVKQCLTA